MKLESAIIEALEQYDTDNVDVVVNFDEGIVDVMYHSNNNSFCIVGNVCKIYDVSEDDIVNLANLYDIGYVL